MSNKKNLRQNEITVLLRQAVKEIQGATHLIDDRIRGNHGARGPAQRRRDVLSDGDRPGLWCGPMELAHNPTITVLMAPGYYIATEGANHGTYTLRFLENFWVDCSIVEASGLSLDGPCEALIEAGEIYTSMLAHASRKILVADKSKFNLRYPGRFAGWADIDLVITDEPPSGEAALTLECHDVSLKIAAAGR